MDLSKLNEFVDQVVLRAAHSLVIPHKYEKVPIEEFKVNEEKTDVEKFGLFSVTSPNLNTFYPDVKPEDINPQDSDFIYPVFRVLSKTVISKFAPIDFSHKDVLQKSMKALIGQTVYTEHEDVIGNHIGTVADVFWQDEYTINGTKVPAGINAIIKVDAKANPKIARGILMDPPAVHSASVSVTYRWAKSHDVDDFYDKLGQFNDKGELIRKIVTDILLYSELSLVPHGADPFAQIQKNGKINNPEFAKTIHNLVTGGKFSYSDYKLLPEGELEVEISTFNQYSNPNNPKNEVKMKEFLVKLASKVDFKAEGDINQDELITHIENKLSDNLKNEMDYSKQIKDLEKEKQTLTSDLDKLKTDLQEFEDKKHLIPVGESRLSEIKEKAENTYKLIKGDNVDENIVKLIQNSEFNVVSSLLKDYEAELEKLSPLTCSKCNSTEVSRASSKRDDENDDGSTDDKVVFKPNYEVIQSRKKKNFTTARIHGE